MSSSFFIGFFHSELLKMIQEQTLELCLFLLPGLLGDFVIHLPRSWQRNLFFQTHGFLGKLFYCTKILPEKQSIFCSENKKDKKKFCN